MLFYQFFNGDDLNTGIAAAHQCVLIHACGARFASHALRRWLKRQEDGEFCPFAHAIIVEFRHVATSNVARFDLKHDFCILVLASEKERCAVYPLVATLLVV